MILVAWLRIVCGYGDESGAARASKGQRVRGRAKVVDKKWMPRQRTPRQLHVAGRGEQLGREQPPHAGRGPLWVIAALQQLSSRRALKSEMSRRNDFDDIVREKSILRRRDRASWGAVVAAVLAG